MTQLLKQSTAFTFRIGPFLDDTDGKTAETGLTIAQADIQISKNGGAFAQTSASPTTTHDTDGWYQCPLTATDTGTLGTLDVQIVVAGALPVWRHFTVVPANVYDSLVAGSDYLTVDAVQVEGADATDTIRDAVVDDATRIDASALNTLSSHDPGEAIMGATDLGTGAGLTSLASAANLTTLTGYVDTEVASILAAVDTEVGAIKAKTDNLPASPAAVGSAMTLASGAITAAVVATGAIDADALATDAVTEIAAGITIPSAASIADAVWDEARSGHTAAGSFGEGVASVQGNVTGSVASVTGAVGSVTGAVGSVTGAVGSVTGNVGGNVAGSVASVTGAVGSVTGNVGGSVASVTAAVTVGTNNDKAGYALSSAGVQAIWDALTSGLTAAGSVGKRIVDYLDAAVSSRSTYAGGDTAGTTTLLGRIVGTLAAGTHNAQSGDAYARLGAPAGASVSADVAAVKAQTAAIEADTQDLQTQVGVDGAGLTALPWNAAWDAEVQSEAADALNAYDPPTNAEMEARTLAAAGYATAANLATLTGYVDTEVAAILADTNELQTDWANGGRLDLLIDAIKAKTDNLPAAPADDTSIDSQLAAIAGYLDTEVAAILAAVDTEVAAIKAKTDNLPAAPADDTSIDSQLAAIAGYLDTEVAAIKAKTDNLPTDPADQSAVEAAITAAVSGLSTLDAAGVRSAVGLASANLDTQLTGLPTDADVQAAAAAAIAAYDPPTKAELDSAVAPLATGANLATVDGIVDSILEDTGTTLPGTLGVIAGYLDTEVAAILAAVDTEVAAIKAKTDNLPASPAASGDIPTAAAVADAVWDEALAGHLGAGSAGAALNASGGAGDPWATALPGAYGAGTAGKIVGDNLNATVSSRLASAAYTAPDNASIAAVKAKTDNLPSDPADQSAVEAAITAATGALATGANLATLAGYVDTEVAAILAAVDTEVAAIKAKTDNLPASPAAVGSAMTLTAAYDAAKTAASQTSVNDLPTNAELAAALASADDAVLAAIAALNNLSSAGAQAAAAAALTAYGAALQTSVDDLEGRLTATRAGYLDNLAGGAVATAAGVAALNNLSSAQAQAAAAAALSAYDPPTKAELDSGLAGLSVPSAASIADAVWDEAMAGHTTAGSAGAAVAAAGVAGDPWAVPLPGSYADGTAGSILDEIVYNVSAVKVVVDTINTGAVTLDPTNDAGHLTITAALTFGTQITGLAVPSDWETALWTLKRARRDADTAAVLQVQVSNPGAGTDGLLVLNGAAATDKTMGSLSINAGAGTADLVLSDDLTAQLAARPGLVWSVKFITAAGKSKEYAGTADVELSVTHEV